MDNTRTVDYLREKYTAKKIRRLYPWAKDIRAGIILLNEGKLLVVQQRAYGNNRSNLGFPKGGMESRDKSAVDAAIRELLEETGVNLHDPALDARISSVVFTVEKPNREDELHLYFLVSIAETPEIRPCPREIIAHKWVEMAKIHAISPVSRATALLLRGLNRVNMASKCPVLMSWRQMFV